MRATLIEIKQDMPGFDHFFGSWVCQDDLAIVVDVGPANTAVRLIESLTYMGVERVDYVFLTHLHIDHCGGLAEFLDHYPMARVICHEKGIDYLTDPSKLWEGSLAVLGEIAEAYGSPEPVAGDITENSGVIGGTEMEFVIETSLMKNPVVGDQIGIYFWMQPADWSATCGSLPPIMADPTLDVHMFSFQ